MKVKTEYSIISRGTEKYSKHGYMGISYPLMNKQYILDIDHGILESEINDHVLEFDANKYSLSNIAVARFELISRMVLERYHLKDNILILGFGNLGFTTLLSLLKNGYQNISVFMRNKQKNLKIIQEIEDMLDIKIKFTDKIDDSYRTYIDTTGSSNVIQNIFEVVSSLKEIVILSTPRDSKYLIDPLIINRKNLIVIGGHELNGIDKKWRNNVFNIILEENLSYEKYLDNFISITKYEKGIVEKLRENKKSLIDVIKY